MMRQETRKLSPLQIKKSETALNKIQEVIRFLNEQYEIRINCFDPTKSMIRSLQKDYSFPPSFDDISLHLAGEGFSINDTILKKILRSPNQMTTYNPIHDYLEGLKGKYGGESHIDLLASHLVARDFGDQEPGYYQDRLRRILRRWLVATAACALGVKPNDVALGFLQLEEGSGKTFLTRFLVPAILKDFYLISQRAQAVFNMEEAFTRNLIVNFDELVGINNRSADEFKKVLSDSDILVKIPRDPFPKVMPRMASAMFTTNRVAELGGFLTEHLGYRRFACLELSSIDQSYSQKVNVDQIWAEAVMLMNQDSFHYVFTMEDYESFRQYNLRYQVETLAMKYLKLYVDHPDEESGEWLSAGEILQRLNHKKFISSEDRMKMSREKLGEALRTLKFDRRNIRQGNIGPRYCYHVCIK
jgi:predicted P-loop ATPase